MVLDFRQGASKFFLFKKIIFRVHTVLLPEPVGLHSFLISVQVEYYAYTGSTSRLRQFKNFLTFSFDKSKLPHGTLSLIGCEITQDRDFSVHLSQEQMLSLFDPQVLLSSIHHKRDYVASPKYVQVYRHVTGKPLYTGRMSAPLLLVHGSMVATKLAELYTHHFRPSATVVKYI